MWILAPLVIAMLSLSVAPQDSKALSYAPRDSYGIIVGAEEEYHFVMLGEWADPFLTDGGEVYPASGLYRNDGSTVPIWQVGRFDDSVKITEEGRFLARIGSPAYSSDELAIAFYDNGKLIRILEVSEFRKGIEKLPGTMGGYRWNLGVAIDESRGLLRIRTLEWQFLYFSMSTGNRVAGPIP